MSRSRMGRRIAALLGALTLTILAAGVVSAHEGREVAGYDVDLGFRNEPVFVGEESGLEFWVMKDEKPVSGLESTLKAEVIYQDQTRDLPLSAKWDDPGGYESVFLPTAAGAYTFHLFGSIEGNAIDESFTSSPEGFSEVEEQAGSQFPVQFPSQAELVAAAEAGKDASSQVTLALGVAVVAVVIGVVAIGVAFANRRRPA